ncbi:MAG: sugar phosphate isomerase/epimerase family protein [Planctomycetota bacterium]
MRIAFSTVACPEWTLDRAIEFAGEHGFDGLEMRTFGHASFEFVPEPSQTGSAKLRDLFEDAGVEPAVLATSIKYSDPVLPPVLGRVIGDFDRPVRETKHMVEVAARSECPFVRVFGFEFEPGEGRKSGLRRIGQRLELALKTARHTGVRLLLENGGSFNTSSDLLELIEMCESPLLAASYSPAAAMSAGEDPVEGLRRLGSRLEVVKLKDFDEGRPVPIGTGEIPNEEVVRELAARGYRGWCSIEWDRAWLPDLEDPTRVLPRSLDTVRGWSMPELTERERRKFASNQIA